MEKADYKGIWWLKNSPKNRLCGSLTFSPEDGVVLLDLAGTFDVTGDVKADADHEIILGLAPDAGEVTLWRCNYNGSSETDFHYHDETHYFANYSVTAAFLGAHLTEFLDESTIGFNGVEVEVSGLQDWLMKTGIDHSRSKLHDHVFTYSRPQEIVCKVDSTDLTIWFGSIYKHKQFAIDFRQKTRVRFNNPKHLALSEWLSEYLIPFQEFVAFASGKPQKIISLDVIVPDYDHRLGGHDRGVKVLFQPWGQQAEMPSGAYPFGWELINSHVMFGRFEEILGNWFALRRDLDSVVQLYVISRFFGQVYGYAEAELVSGVQALESFYARRRAVKGGNKGAPANELRDALEKLPKRERERERRRITNPSLEDKLANLFEECSQLLSPILGDQTAFPSSVTTTRNYFIHFLPEHESSRLRDLQLINATDVLWAVVEYFLLRELGFSNDESLKMVMNTKRYQDIGKRHLLRSW